MANETMKLAAELIKNPKLLDQYSGQYLIVMDQAITYPRFDILNQAICLMAEQGWRAINIATISNTIGIKANMMYVLMERKIPESRPANIPEVTQQQVNDLSEQSNRIASILERFEQHLEKSTSSSFSNSQDKRICPKCNAPMTIQVATKGEHQGKQFYVCSNYPTCKEVLPA